MSSLIVAAIFMTKKNRNRTEKYSCVCPDTLMIQQVLSQKKWYDLMTPEDFRGLTPLRYAHINPYGQFDLDMEERILIEREVA